MDTNNVDVNKISKKFLILTWLVAVLFLMAFEPLLVASFPPNCVFWICFGWSLIVVLVLNYILLVGILALIVPTFQWKVVRGVIIIIAAFPLLIPFNMVMSYPSKLVRQMILDAKIKDYENNYPEITITSPTPNSVFEAGKSYNVTWETKNIPADSNIGISIGYDVSGDFPNSGHATLMMPNRFSDYAYDCTLKCSPITIHTLIFNYVLPDEVIKLHQYSTKKNILYVDIPTVRATTTVKLIDPSALEANRIIRRDVDALRSKVVALYNSKKNDYTNLCFHDGRAGIDLSALGGNNSLWDVVGQLSRDKYYKEGDIERSGDGITCVSDKNGYALSVTAVPSDDGPIGYCFDSTQNASDPLIEGWADRATYECATKK